MGDLSVRLYPQDRFSYKKYSYQLGNIGFQETGGYRPACPR